MQAQISKFKQELIEHTNIPEFQIDRIFEITTINKTIEICIQNDDGIRDFTRVEKDNKIKITEELVNV